MALITALSSGCEDLPAITVASSGAGAGTKDFPDRPNITRVIVGELSGADQRTDEPADRLLIMEANVDDLDPRLWPGILTRLLEAGAADAWLVPIVMKKGRPGHVLTVLCRPDLRTPLQELIMAHTSTLGVRGTEVTRSALSRDWVSVDVDGRPIRIKIGYDASGIRQANPEFDEVAALAAATGVPEREVLDRARAAARAADLVVGAAPPRG
jgi:uncharacterized protein (DUF111 family)